MFITLPDLIFTVVAIFRFLAVSLVILGISARLNRIYEDRHDGKSLFSFK